MKRKTTEHYSSNTLYSLGKYIKNTYVHTIIYNSFIYEEYECKKNIFCKIM